MAHDSKPDTFALRIEPTLDTHEKRVDALLDRINPFDPDAPRYDRDEFSLRNDINIVRMNLARAERLLRLYVSQKQWDGVVEQAKAADALQHELFMLCERLDR